MTKQKSIKIDRYEQIYENGSIQWYAVKGEKKYPMPKCYAKYYDDNHLAIVERTIEMPEVIADDLEPTHYIPLQVVKA